ncbi:MAG TPA: hypothetical protein VIG30_06700 [Ktedonobacterales bacterium]|jgi:hypothetical protein
MEANELVYAKGVLIRLAHAARSDFALAQQVREIVLVSGILDLFGVSEDLNLFDLLEAGGDELLRARLGQLDVAHLKRIVAARGYDPEKTSARWRSPARFVEMIAVKASEQWQQLTLTRIVTAPTQRITPGDALAVAAAEAAAEPDADPAAGAAWML